MWETLAVIVVTEAARAIFKD